MKKSTFFNKMENYKQVIQNFYGMSYIYNIANNKKRKTKNMVKFKYHCWATAKMNHKTDKLSKEL